MRGQLAARDTALAEACADKAAASARADEQAARRGELETALATMQERAMTGERTHAEALAAVQARYEALSKQLLQETAHQRDAVRAERTQLASQRMWPCVKASGGHWTRANAAARWWIGSNGSTLQT